MDESSGDAGANFSNLYTKTSVTEGVEMYTCNPCGNPFKTSNEVNQHLMDQHVKTSNLPQVPPFICPGLHTNSMFFLFEL